MQAVAENRTILKDASGARLVVAEKTTLRITATLLDESGLAIPSAGLTTLTPKWTVGSGAVAGAFVPFRSPMAHLLVR